MFHRHDHDEPQRDEQQPAPAPEPAAEPAEPWAEDAPADWTEQPGSGAPQEVTPEWTEEAP